MKRDEQLRGGVIKWYFVDKRAWEPGPWHAEPDKMQWQDAQTGLTCLAVRGPMGAWCGYVGVPESHPWHGLGYGAVPDMGHGGLTFADECMKEAGVRDICHIGTDRPWWLGFDCAHAGDLCPAMETTLREGRRTYGAFRGVYRDLGYVQAQCAAMAQMIAAYTTLRARERSMR